MHLISSVLTAVLCGGALFASIGFAPAGEPVERPLVLPPGPDNPRNSEGDFIQLGDGRILFIYTRFSGGKSDHASADLVSRVSTDGGATWSQEDEMVIPNEGKQNIMSVSLLRLQDGRIALFYLRKDSSADCRPVMRVSANEGKTWSKPRDCVTDEVGYYVLNNDRAVQLESGRIVLPMALHKSENGNFTGRGRALCYYSDDHGKTFKRSDTVLELEDHPKDGGGLQEPGVVALKDGRLMMFSRTYQGSQYISYSEDDGVTWSKAQPSDLKSPLSPASIERIPSTGDLLVAWNDHRPDDINHGKRTPFNVAISRDEGKTWGPSRTLEDDPQGWYCYTAIEFVGDHVLLGHVAGQQTGGPSGLDTTQITRFPVEWLYE